MKRMVLSTITAALILGFAAAVVAMGPPGGTIWVDGIKFRTIDTGNRLPNHGPKDGIFAIQGLDGQGAVAEAKPGDRDYNGGRWQVYVLEWTEAGKAVHDASGDGVVDEGMELTSWEDVLYHMNSLGHLQQVQLGPSFVCPVIRY